jgi:hypothetical protein
VELNIPIPADITPTPLAFVLDYETKRQIRTASQSFRTSFRKTAIGLIFSTYGLLLMPSSVSQLSGQAFMTSEIARITVNDMYLHTTDPDTVG